MPKKNMRLYKQIERILSERPKLELEFVVRGIWSKYCMDNNIHGATNLLGMIKPNSPLPSYQLIQTYYKEIKKKRPENKSWLRIYHNTIMFLHKNYGTCDAGGVNLEKKVLTKEKWDGLSNTKIETSPMYYEISLIQLEKIIKIAWENDESYIKLITFSCSAQKVLYMIFDKKEMRYEFYRRRKENQ